MDWNNFLYLHNKKVILLIQGVSLISFVNFCKIMILFIQNYEIYFICIRFFPIYSVHFPENTNLKYQCLAYLSYINRMSPSMTKPTSKFSEFMSPKLKLNYNFLAIWTISKEKIDLRIISKPHAHLQTMTKKPVKFQKDWHKSVRGVGHTKCEKSDKNWSEDYIQTTCKSSDHD